MLLDCKQKRRKCERSGETEPCQRCMKMKKKCVHQDETSENESSDDYNEDNAELVLMSQQVKDLELELKHLEISLNQQRALVKKEPSWDIQVVNGELRLGSEIKSLEELMLYGLSTIRYLSPFGKTFGTASLKFQRINPSFIKTAMNIVSRVEIQGNNQQTSIIAISQRFSSEFVQYIQPRIFIDELVDLYFKCFNSHFPLVHEPSFREHFKGLKDPMDDPVTLAMCARSAIATCEHSFFNSQEKRYVGEIFYKRAMDRLLEMFDDPDKALESIVIINILQFFMYATLRLRESKKWATIASLLASHLLQENPRCLLADDSLPLLTRIKYAIIQRNNVVSECILAVVEVVSSSRKDDIIHSKGQFDILPDENESVKGLLTMLNYSLLLTFHPASVIVFKQAQNMAMGETAELNFEEIIQFEGVVVDWWHNLPDHLKICSEPYNCTAELVKSTNDLFKLLMACYLYTITLSVQGCLIAPTYKVGLENVHGTVRDRAMYLSMHSVDMLLTLTNKIGTLDTICHCK